MVDKVREDILERISKIEHGNFDHDDIRLLFIDLRDSIPKGAEPELGQIYDLFNYVAHPNIIERGARLKIAKNIARQLTDAIEKGGSVNINLFDFSITEYIGKILDLNSILYDRDKLKSRECDLMLHAYKILDGVELGLDSKMITSTYIYSDANSNQVYFSYKLVIPDTTIGTLTISSSSPTIRLRLM